MKVYERMSDGEIAGFYRERKYKNRAIATLMEMNLCSREEIVSILKKYGYKIPDKDPKVRGQTNRKKAQGENGQDNAAQDKTDDEEGKVTAPDVVYADLVEKNSERKRLIEKRERELEELKKEFDDCQRFIEKMVIATS